MDWRRLKHHYGTAEDVPGWLRDCAGDDPERAGEALDEFDMAVYHQGGWICPAAVAALPFLVDLAVDAVGPAVGAVHPAVGAVHHRAAIVELVGRFVHETGRIGPENVGEDWLAALEREKPRLMELLDDPDPAVRRAAIGVVSDDGMPQGEVLAALRRRWMAENDRITRWDLVGALGRFPEPGVRALLHGLLDDADPQTGLAAVHALARTEPEIPAARLPQLVAACRDPGIAAWSDSAWIGRSIVHRTGQLLRHDRVAAAEFAVALGGGEGMHQAAALLARWRSAGPALHGFLADRLADDDAEVRFRAAYLLACVPVGNAGISRKAGIVRGTGNSGNLGDLGNSGNGSDRGSGGKAGEVADALVALIGDGTPAGDRRHGTVGDAAVWALTRLGDVRCLPAVRERFAGPHLGFALTSEFFTTPPGSWHSFWLPAVDEALSALAAHAAALVPAVRVGTSHALCRLLGAWGPASAPAVPQLVALLGHRHLETTAATAIGEIGPAAADDLRKHAPMPAAAWAHWRVTGDPSLALPALARAASPQDLRLLGTLGPLAADHADRLRRLSRSTDDRVRVEAAHTHYLVTADPALAVEVLTEAAQPLAAGDCLPVRITALEHLAAIGAEPAHPIARAVLDSPHRLSYFGGWHVFAADERLRAAATALLGNSLARPVAPVE